MTSRAFPRNLRATMVRSCLLLPAALLLGGCGRDAPKQSPTTSAAVPAPSAPVSLSENAGSGAPAGAPNDAAAPRGTFTFALDSTEGAGGKTEVWIVSRELELREKIASVAPEIGCVLGPTPEGWAVWCADVFPNAVATLRRGEGVIALERLGAPSRALALPAGADVRLDTVEASSRGVAGRACDEATKSRPLKAIVSTHSNAGDSYDNGRVAVVEGGRTIAWPLPKVRADAICRVTDRGDGTRELVCAKAPVCGFKAAPGRLEIVCGEARTLALSRCGTVPTVELETISRSRAYQ